MDEIVTITGRKFSLSVRGYDQDEVDAFLQALAARLNGPDANPAQEAEQIAAGARFTIVTLGYTRSEVHQHLNDLWALLMRRGGRPVTGDLIGAPREAAMWETSDEPAEETLEAHPPAPESLPPLQPLRADQLEMAIEADPQPPAETAPAVEHEAEDEVECSVGAEADTASEVELAPEPEVELEAEPQAGSEAESTPAPEAPVAFAPAATYPWMMAPVQAEEPVAQDQPEPVADEPEAETEEQIEPEAEVAEMAPQVEQEAGAEADQLAAEEEKAGRTLGSFLRWRPRTPAEPVAEAEPEPDLEAEPEVEAEPTLELQPDVEDDEPAAVADEPVHAPTEWEEPYAARESDAEPVMVAEPEPEPVLEAEPVAAPVPFSMDAERAALFAIALDMGVEDAVSMTRDELQAAIDSARGAAVEEPAQNGGSAHAEPEPAAEPEPVSTVDPVSDEVKAALCSARNALNAFEALLNGEVAELGGAVRRQREATQRECLQLVESAEHDAERIMESARLRISELAASAERDELAMRARAQAYADRIRRSAERGALRETVEAAGETAASLPGAEKDEPSAEQPVDPAPAAPEQGSEGEWAEDRPSVVGLTRDIIKLLQGRPVSDRDRQ